MLSQKLLRCHDEDLRLSNARKVVTAIVAVVAVAAVEAITVVAIVARQGGGLPPPLQENTVHVREMSLHKTLIFNGFLGSSLPNDINMY